MTVKVGLCGRSGCRRLCVRSQYCELGQARFSWLLELQRQQDQQARWRVVRQAIEANVISAAGTFETFQLQLILESQRPKNESV